MLAGLKESRFLYSWTKKGKKEGLGEWRKNEKP